MKTLALSITAFALTATADDPPRDDAYIAVKDATVWPNLTRLPSGDILLAGLNVPSHGQREGDVGCWISSDDGESWESVGRMTQHDPDTVRMNQAVGLNQHGHIVGLVSGWTNVQQEGAPKRDAFRDAILRPWVCISEDEARNWDVTKEFPVDPAGRELIPFGDIILSADGRLNVSAYSTAYWDHPDPWAAFFLTSEDDGRTWQVDAKIDDNINETALLNLGDGQWLAVARSTHLTQYRSTDDGQTWTNEGAVTNGRQIPGHLLKLKDGRLLLSYGDRSQQKGVKVKISDDLGKTWSAPTHLASMPATDGGYPSSVQRNDGKILTLFYTKTEDTYVVKAIIWEVPSKTE